MRVHCWVPYSIKVPKVDLFVMSLAQLTQNGQPQPDMTSSVYNSHWAIDSLSLSDGQCKRHLPGEYRYMLFS